MGNDFQNEAVRWPFGNAKIVAIATFAAAMSATIADRKTFVNLPQLTGNATLDVVPSPEQLLGDEVIVKWSTAATQTLTFNNMIDGPVVTGVAGKTFQQKFEYDGSVFNAVAPAVQLN